MLEDKWGVSANAPVAAVVAPTTSDQAEAEELKKSLETAGAKVELK